jgi:hypothetical protein
MIVAVNIPMDIDVSRMRIFPHQFHTGQMRVCCPSCGLDALVTEPTGGALRGWDRPVDKRHSR